MKHSKLFIFYLIFYVCGRIYNFATNYPDALFLHLIGLQFSFHSLLYYLVFHLKDKSTAVPKSMWFSYLFIICIGWFTYNEYGFRESMIMCCVVVHVYMIATISRINLKVGYKNLTKRALWLGYFTYEIEALFFYTKTQYLNYQKYAYDFLVSNWGITIAKSGAKRLSDVSYHYQNLYIPISVGLIILFVFGCLDKYVQKNCIEVNDNRIFILIKKPNGILGFIKLLWSKNLSFIYAESDEEIKNLQKEHILFDTGIQFDDKNELYDELSFSIDKTNFYRYLSEKERLFLLRGENKELIIVLIRWLSFSVSRLNKLEPGESPKKALIDIFNYPIKLLKNLLK